jgi:hypothetical protein
MGMHLAHRQNPLGVIQRSSPRVITHSMLLVAEAGRAVRDSLGVGGELYSPDACFSGPVIVPE